MKDKTKREIRFQVVFSLLFIGFLVFILGMYYNFFTFKNLLGFIFVSMNPEVTNHQIDVNSKLPSLLSLTIPASAIVTAYAALRAAKAYTRQASSAEKDIDRKEKSEIQDKFEIAKNQLKCGDETDVKLGFTDFFNIVTSQPVEYLDNAYVFLIKTITSSYSKTIANNQKLVRIINTNTEISIKKSKLKQLEDGEYGSTNTSNGDLPPYPYAEIISLTDHIRELTKGAYIEEANNINELYRLKKTFQLIGKIRNNNVVIDAELELGITHRLMLSDIQFSRISRLIEIFKTRFTIANANFENFKFENCEFTGVSFENVNFCYKSFEYSGAFEEQINSDYFVDMDILGTYNNSICVLRNADSFSNEDPLYFAETEYKTIVWCDNIEIAEKYKCYKSNNATCFDQKFFKTWQKTRDKPNSMPANQTWPIDLKPR